MADETNVNDQEPVADEAAQSDLPEIDVAVEDAGTLKKKVSITIPRGRIDAKYDEMFGELSRTAQVPGFRIGRAPRKLIEKRFGKEVGQDVRNAVIGESLSDAMDKSELKTIGEPDLDLEKIELPETGDMTYDFEVEVQPEFELPDVKGIEVTKHAYEVDDARVDEYLEQLAQSRATYELAEAAAETGDLVLAGATISGEGIETQQRPGLQLRVAPVQVEGLPLVDLADQLAGKKAGDTVEVKVRAPEAHPNEDWRNKELTVALELSEVRRREMPKIDAAFAEQAGFDSLKEMREFVAGQLKTRVEAQTQRDMREQVSQYLLDQTDFELPEGLVARQTAGVLRRRYVDLLYQGVPRERIDEQLTELQAAAGQEAHRILKLSFITSKIAEADEIEVADGEVNARIAQMAAQADRRPERLRQELAQDGSLGQVEAALLEEKVLEKLLAEAKIVEAKPEKRAEAKKAPKKVKKTEKPTKAAAEKKPTAKKKTAKKASAKGGSKKATKKSSSK